MVIFMNDKINNLRFIITDEMKNNLFDALIYQKILDNEKLLKRERKILEREKNRLLDNFRTLLQSNNPLEVSIVREYLNIK